MPLTAGKVPEALKEIEGRKAYYLKKRMDVKENGTPVVDEEADIASSSKTGKASSTKPNANGVPDFNAEEWPGITISACKDINSM